jgi:cytochrome c oxidase subunit 1
LFRKYVFSLDHKVMGLQYALTSLGFLLIGFSLALIFRWQLAYPGRPVPVIGGWFGDLNATICCSPFRR